jgi:hypothetical protein
MNRLLPFLKTAMKSIVLFLSLLVMRSSVAGSVPASLVAYQVIITTLQGYRLSGLLLHASDSGLLIYPGNWKEWKKKQNFQPVFIPSTKVQVLVLKHRKRAFRGALVGAGLTAGMLVVAIAGSEGAGYLSLLGGPLAPVLGAVAGKCTKRKFSISGDTEAYLLFRKKINQP